MHPISRRAFVHGATAAFLGAPEGEGGGQPDRADAWPHDPGDDALIATAQRSVADAAPIAAADRLRPQFHFLPPGRFMNDPNGCVWFDGAYHVFYQHLPFWGVPGAANAPGWGHAASRDLVRWEHWPIALMPRPGKCDAGGVASGCCVVADGLPTIVYTSVPPQAQSLARSFDGMRTWRRYADNPVLAAPPGVPGLADGFRDPFVWREDGQWRMLVGSGITGVGGTALLYESTDLMAWRYLGRLSTGMGPDCYQWECPFFFRVDDRWVLIVSPLLHSEPAIRGPVQYAVGRYDGRVFEHDGWRWLDLGGPGVFYAPHSLIDPRGRRILWGWLMGGGTPGSLWDGLLTLPRTVQIAADGRLRTWPTAEVDTLRAESMVDEPDRVLRSGEMMDLPPGTQVDLVVDLAAGSSGRLEVHALHSPMGDRGVLVSLDPTSGEVLGGPARAGAQRRFGPTRRLRLLLDRSVVEAFTDAGAALSLRAHPAEGDEGVRLRAADGEIALRRLRAWRMTATG